MTLVWASGYNGITDPDAQTYIAAVEAADGQAIEGDVAFAINDFVIGCKTDGIWDAIKASCILAGARTLSGALVPLKGVAPTNVNIIVSGAGLNSNYNRETGITTFGNTAQINTNIAYNSISSDNEHLSIYRTSNPTIAGAEIGAGISSPTCVSRIAWSGSQKQFDVQDTFGFTYGATTYTGFNGVSRASSSTMSYRDNSTTVSVSKTSQTRANISTPYYVFAINYSDLGVLGQSNSRISFYSIGESLDLALLDNRVSTLMTDIGAAIP